jgi:hypothetical protein
VGSSNLYNQYIALGTTSATVNNLPANGSPVYVRLFTRFSSGWQSTDYTYTAVTGKAAMTDPVGGSTLTATSQLFTWSAGTGALQYALYVGTTGVGSSNLYNQYIALGTTSATVNNLPANGSPVYVRLFTRFSSGWQSTDYTYTAVTGKAAMTSPVGGTTINGASQLFTWSAGTGALQYALYVGTTGVGSSNLFNQYVATPTTSATVSTLPANNSTINVRLWTRFNGGWQFNDYTYTSAP